MKRLDRRALLRLLPLGGLACLIEGNWRWPAEEGKLPPGSEDLAPPVEQTPPTGRPAPPDPLRDEGASRRAATAPGPRQKSHDFDRAYPDDVLLPVDKLAILESAAARLERAARVIGHGFFNLVSFDALLRYAARYDEIGRFPREELDLLDETFHADARQYGFYGEKVLTRQTAVIAARDVEKVPHTGHYLLRGEPLAKYLRIRSDLGERVFLTSGVRAIAKQYQLFLSKAVTTGGNLSQASRSLAPPGYSYHAIGDFDLGRVGFGLRNFTAEFAETPEYQELIDLGYIDIRYTEANPYGVRHEPWHIKIAT